MIRVMPSIQLNSDDIDLARQVGLERESTWQQSQQPSLAIVYDSVRHLEANIIATQAEIAVARYLNREWLGQTYTGPQGCDVAPNIEVRLTNVGRGLYIKNREVTNTLWEKKPSTIYTLVYETDEIGRFDLAGWITLNDGLRYAERYQSGNVIGWIVPITRLHSMELLRDAEQ